VIVIMSVALLGLSGIQSYWIKQAVDLNKSNFDYKVFEALKSTSSRLSIKEVQAVLSSSASSEFAVEDKEPLDWEEMTEVELSSTMKMYLTPEEEDQLNNQSLEDRISLILLDSILSQELRNSGIELNFNYGVLDLGSGHIIIENGHYAYFDEFNLEGTLTPYNKKLTDSKYRVQLFVNDPIPPGLLVVEFPQKSSVVYGSVVGIIVLSVIFTLLVLGVFAYTICIIFRQKKLSEMKNDFINNMTHELKTPIATISLAADSLNNAKINTHPEKIEKFANVIKQENERMLNQVEKVLQMALIDTQQLHLNLKEIRIHEMVEVAVRNNQLRVKQRGGELRFTPKAQRDLIFGDEIHISNLIYNLIDNAIKYSPDTLSIEVLTREEEGWLVLEVKDRGLGISKEQRKHIFDRFYRGQMGNLHDVKGFGLGLSYVWEIITAHGGKIEVDSELGKGSIFRVFFKSMK
jgi:two-component system, OmpR family, phosphate regulon sensor histidine kinase PhoR